VLSPETGPPSIRALYPATTAQKGEEVLRRDGILFGHLQRRRPLASRLLSTFGKAERINTSGKEERGAMANSSSRLASSLSPSCFHRCSAE
jgi:hypothetical protein